MLQTPEERRLGERAEVTVRGAGEPSGIGWPVDGRGRGIGTEQISVVAKVVEAAGGGGS